MRDYNYTYNYTCNYTYNYIQRMHFIKSDRDTIINIILSTAIDEVQLTAFIPDSC